MFYNIKRGFNKIKVYNCLENNIDYIFNCNIINKYNIDFEILCLDSYDDCISYDIKLKYSNWYNEIGDTINYTMKYNCLNKNYDIYLVCYSNYNFEIQIKDINNYVNNLDLDQKFTYFFNYEKYKYKLYFNMSWKNILENEINLDNSNGFDYPLIENTYEKEEIIGMIQVLLSNRLTMGKKVLEFENKFAKYVGAKYAVMVNSGSSANLLAMAVASNYMRKNKLNKGDKIIVPNICWSTSVWPIIQMGLVPVFVDVDHMTMNMDINELKKLITPDIKGIVAVHILGNCTNMDELMKIVKDNNLFLMEDTCESLGSKYDGKMLGTFGDFGTYSFYYSHHITTIEGGMIVCNDEEDFELLKCLRAHGWTRYLKNKKELEDYYSNVDSRFLFVNVGYNLRPMETQGAMGLIQLNKLDIKNKSRIYNHDIICDKILNDSRNKNIFITPYSVEKSEPAWFGLTFIMNEKYLKHYKLFLEYLTEKKVENRPVVTGNFARQPIFKFMDIEIEPTSYKGAEILHTRGFFIGLSCSHMNDERINNLVEIFYGYKFD